MNAHLIQTLVTANNLNALTHCADCGRALKDTTSVEVGVGPDCRKHGNYDTAMEAISDSLKVLARAAIKSIAFAQTGAEIIPQVDVLRSLGFDKLAERVELRLADVVVLEKDGMLEVTHSYNPEAFYAFARIPGRVRCPKSKTGPTHRIPADAYGKGAVCTVLKAHFAGQLVYGQKGLAVIESGWKRAPRFDLATLEAMASKLSKSTNAACQAKAEQVAAFVDGTAHANTQADWRPEIPMAEDFYAL